MKILMKPIEVLAWFDNNGIPHPLRIKINGNHVEVEQLISMSEEKQAGNRIIIFRCQSEINGILKPYELKCELSTCKWFLYKM